MKAKKPLFGINPNTRLHCDNLSIGWKELPYHMMWEEINHHPNPLGVYKNRSGDVIIIPSLDYSSAEFLYCSSVDFSNLRLQHWLKRKICVLIEERANIILPQRLHVLENKHRLYVKSITVKELRKHILGQCDFYNRISLSPQILLYPTELMGSVILHEMAHIKHKYHRKSFWAYLSLLLGEDAKEQNVILDLVISKNMPYIDFLFH